jgi:hypothetical protein
MDFSRNILFKCFLVCAVLFSLQVIPRWWGDSIVMDEEWDVTASYYYWKRGDVVAACGTTAPGALCALPLLFMDLKHEPIESPDWRLRSLKLIFMDNPHLLSAVTISSRSIDWLLGLLIGFFLYWTVRQSPLPRGAAVLFLWAFEPTLLAFSGTAKTDLSVAFWFFISVLYFNRIQSRGKMVSFTTAGLLAGLTAATRYNGLLILPTLLVMDVLYTFNPGGGARALVRRVPVWLALLGGFSAIISLLYLPGYFQTDKQYWPLALYLGDLIAYIEQRPGVTSQTICFAGRFWEHGTYLSFPYHFFFKNTLPFLALLGTGIGLGLLKKGFLPRWVWVPPVIYVGVFYLGDKSMTIRHALPAYPFLILIAARAFQWFWQKGRDSSWAWARALHALPILLLIWHAGGVLYNFPHHIAYANEFVGTQNKPARLYSFNWNLGQDMKRLAETAKARGWKRVKLLTGQRTDPYFYGMPWQSWTEQDFVQPQPGTVYVVDPSFLNDRSEYNIRVVHNNSWLIHTSFTGTLGGTLDFYEIPGALDDAPKDKSPEVNSFPYYAGGIPPYRRTTGPETWIAP